MKKSIVSLSLMAALAMTGMSAQAASTGTVTFNGELTDTTCDVDINGQGTDAAIALPVVSVNELTTAGNTTGRTSFVFNLTNCTVASGGMSKVAAFFQPGESVDLSSGRLKNTRTGGATNVDLQLLDASGGYKTIKVGDSAQTTDMAFVDINQVDGSAQLPYAVEYYANGKTTAGKVTSSVVYNLQYK